MESFPPGRRARSGSAEESLSTIETLAMVSFYSSRRRCARSEQWSLNFPHFSFLIHNASAPELRCSSLIRCVYPIPLDFLDFFEFGFPLSSRISQANMFMQLSVLLIPMTRSRFHPSAERAFKARSELLNLWRELIKDARGRLTHLD